VPHYLHASYAGTTVTLENDFIRLDVHKRLSGWGWGEIFTHDGTYMGILEHFGEIMLRDQDVPMRLEAEEVRRELSPSGEALHFTVKSAVMQEKIQGTSFEQWVHFPLHQPCVEGEITLTLLTDLPIIQVHFDLKATANVYARYLRGPWLKIGADAFGAEKVDAIFPGVEWLVGDEWSSGTDWFKDPWARRWAPHPHKVSIPLLVLSHQGTACGMWWKADSPVTRWFNYREHYAQPVFASPNFIDRQNNHLLGLMLPDAWGEADENKVYADQPLELHPGQSIVFEATLFLCSGDSLDGVVEWVKQNGLPEVPEPRWPLVEALHRIASAYNSRFWYEGKGFGNAQFPAFIRPYEPRFLQRYVNEYGATPLGQELKAKLEWCRQHPHYVKPRLHHMGKLSRVLSFSREEQLAYGQELLALQREDGAFPFDPDHRHYTKDDFVVSRAMIEPMGLAGDTALAISIVPAMELLVIGEITGEQAFLEGARKTLDFCLPMRRPEGGDFWETPLHSPNLLAAGHAAIAYFSGYRHFATPAYKAKAIQWIRSLLPFTHLWQPDHSEMVYNTKPCLCASDWYFANWVRDHVQWEVLETFATSSVYGIDWAEVDPAIDWQRYHEGITVASLRWMIDHRQENWRPHNLPATFEAYKQGLLDDTFADTHNSVTGNYGGMVILPDVIAINIMALLDYRKSR